MLTRNSLSAISAHETETSQSAMFIRVTPELASTLIAESDGNYRTLKKSNLEKLEAAMTMDWKASGATVVVDDRGKLIDGFHRMRTCVCTGRSFDTWCVVGVTQDESEAIDVGVSRSLEDWLKHQNFRNAQHLKNAISILNRFKQSDEYPNSRAAASVPEAKAILAEFPYLPEIVSKSLCCRNSGVTTGVFSSVIALSCREYFDNEHTDYALDVLSNKRIVSDGDPILTLYRYAFRFKQRNKSSQATLRPKQMIAATIIAWNALLRGITLRRIRFVEVGPNRQSFPKIDRYADVMGNP